MGGGSGIFAGIGGGNLRINPKSESMVVVTKKNTNNRKAISAIDPALISGISRFDIIQFYRVYFITAEATIETIDKPKSTYNEYNKVPDNLLIA